MIATASVITTTTTITICNISHAIMQTEARGQGTGKPCLGCLGPELE